MTPPRARATTPTRSYNLRNTPARTAHYAKHPHVEPSSIRARRQARSISRSPPTSQSSSSPDSPIQTPSQPSSSIASPPTFAISDDDDERPLAQLHSLSSATPPLSSSILPTPSQTQQTTQTINNISSTFHQPFRVPPITITPDRSPSSVSPTVHPRSSPRLPPDLQTASSLAAGLTVCHITSPSHFPQPQPTFPSPITVHDSPSPLSSSPAQSRTRIFLSTNQSPQPLLPMQNLYAPPLPFANRPVSTSFQSTDHLLLPLSSQPSSTVPLPTPSPVSPSITRPTLPPPSSRSSIIESIEQLSNIPTPQPFTSPTIPSHIPQTPVHTPPSPPTPSSVNPPTPQSLPHANSITTRASLRAPYTERNNRSISVSHDDNDSGYQTPPSLDYDLLSSAKYST